MGKNPIIKADGSKHWFNNEGKLHRIDGPAIEYADGYKAWYDYGVRHRIDGPAIEYASGSKEWFKDGVRHRIDGPAIEYASGSKEWWLGGELHRIDGPAREYANGSKEWWLNGVKLSLELYLQLTGDVKDLPLYMGLGFDSFIHERLTDE